MFPLGRTVTLITRTVNGRDQEGNQTYADTSVSVSNVAVWPRSSSELVQGQDTVIAGLTALLPPGTDVSAIDAVLVDGKKYEVDGQPPIYVSPFTGTNPGVEVQLTEVAG